MARPRVNRYKPDSEPGTVSQDTSRHSEGIFTPETSQGTALVGGSGLDKETAFDSDENYGKFDIHWENFSCMADVRRLRLPIMQGATCLAFRPMIYLPHSTGNLSE